MYQSVPQRHHALLPRPDHDEQARQLFARDFRRYILLDVPQHTRRVFEHTVKPAMLAQAPEAVSDPAAVREAMWQQGFIRAAQGLQRVSQELLWNSVVPYVQRRADDVNARVQALGADQGSGSLTLDPDFEVPAYLKDVDIHCMPGNYHAEYAPGDAVQGAVFDRGSFLYALGGMGECNDATARTLITALRERYPELAPRRILDLGCTMGHNTLPLCEAFPDAEIHAVDAAAPMLRYAHARARDLGYDVHWRQADVRETGYPDGHFDLVVSVILFHEVHPDEIEAVFRECRRLLAPGGVTAHIDIPDYFKSPDPLFVSLVDADHFHNNEPFWGEMHRRDLQGLLANAGFPASEAFRGIAPMGSFPWSFFGARREAAAVEAVA